MNDYTPTPDFYNDYICHYGVKGMKWHKHNAAMAKATGSSAYATLAGWSDDEYQKRLARVKLTNGRSSSSSSKSKSSGSSSSGSKTSSSAKKETAEKKTTTKDKEEKVVYKTQINPEYTKYLERKQIKKNTSKLNVDDILKRLRTKKRS